MALGQSFAIGLLCIVIVDDGFALPDAIGPNTGLVDRIMMVVPFDLALGIYCIG
jgi:hypothetical protein